MKHILFIFIPFIPFITCSFDDNVHINTDAIVGKWMNTDSNLEVAILKSGNEYNAYVVWFDDTDDKTRPMTGRLDSKNPDKALRTRKIIGMEVMHGLVYNRDKNEWQGGRIYDASTGKKWNVIVWIGKDSCLEARGFWHFEFLGQNMRFKKVL